MYIEKNLCVLSAAPRNTRPLIVTAVSGQAQKTSAESDKVLFFSCWTKVLPGAAQGKVNQVTAGVIGVNIISVTKCVELFLLDAVLGKDLLGSLAILLLPRRVVCQHFSETLGFLIGILGSTDISPFVLQHRKRKEQNLMLCMN